MQVLVRRAFMTQQIHTAGGQQQHTIWQDGKMPEPCVIVIFGATGDLAQRKLLPTLAHLMHDHPLPESFKIVAFARRPMNDDQWRKMALDSVNKYLPPDDKLDSDAQKAFARSLYYCQSHFNDREGDYKLADLLERLNNDQGTAGQPRLSLATPPPTDSHLIYPPLPARPAPPTHHHWDQGF